MWLVKEVSLLVITEPQLDFRPGVGQMVGVDNHCKLPLDWLKGMISFLW
jgi:hypothetical protein